MSSRNFNDFFQYMDHEFPDEKDSLRVKGYKIDGEDGIKIATGFRDLKSADYFSHINENSTIIEFSNIQQHLENINYQENKVAENAKDLRSNERRIYDKLLKILRNEIKDENIRKFKDTLIIAENAKQYLEDVPLWILDDRRILFLIVSQFKISDNEVAKKRKRLPVQQSDFSRYLEYLASTLKHEIPNNKCKKVVVITLPQFVNSL